MNREKALKIAMSAAVSGGNFLSEHSADLLRVSSKESLRDIVTEADKSAEKKIIKILRENSDAPVLTEESGKAIGKNEKDYWVVDPLDGTVNYVNHVPFYAVSVAFVEDDSPVVGVVYNPLSSDLYYGAEGIGIFKNHAKIRVKDRTAEECLFAVAFSGKNYNPAERSKEFLMFEKVNDSSRGCLRTGSAAMNLSYLAEGRLGGCWGKANKLWDVAAGLLLARLAGATVEYNYVNPEKTLVSYIASVPSAFGFVKGKINFVRH